MFARVIVAVAVVAAAATPARAGYTTLLEKADEVAARQSAGMESALFGARAPMAPYGQNISIHPLVGGYGDDGILSGLAASWRTTQLVPWEMGVSVGVLDLGIATWTMTLSSSRRVWNGKRSAVTIEGAFAYQFFTESLNDGTAVLLDDPAPTGAAPADVLLDSFDLVHAMMHAVYTVDLWFLRPMVDLGWVGTRYRVDGNEWEGSFPVTRGTARHTSGGVSKVTFGLGASLDVARAILFGGIRVVDDAGLFQATVGFDF